VSLSGSGAPQAAQAPATSRHGSRRRCGWRRADVRPPQRVVKVGAVAPGAAHRAADQERALLPFPVGRRAPLRTVWAALDGRHANIVARCSRLSRSVSSDGCQGRAGWPLRSSARHVRWSPGGQVAGFSRMSGTRTSGIFVVLSGPLVFPGRGGGRYRVVGRYPLRGVRKLRSNVSAWRTSSTRPSRSLTTTGSGAGARPRRPRR
jgi:hypothetical protein